jgi:hypothetical protein
MTSWRSANARRSASIGVLRVDESGGGVVIVAWDDPHEVT